MILNQTQGIKKAVLVNNEPLDMLEPWWVGDNDH